MAGKHCFCVSSDSGRGYLPWYSLINGIGVLIATGYSGFVTTGERVPWAGYVSVIFFITGFVLPLIIEHRRLGSGFEEIEATFRSNRHREINPPHEEVLVPSTSPRPQRRQGQPVSIVVICAVIATGLLGFDIIDLIINMSASNMPSDRISNF